MNFFDFIDGNIEAASPVNDSMEKSNAQSFFDFAESFEPPPEEQEGTLLSNTPKAFIKGAGKEAVETITPVGRALVTPLEILNIPGLSSTSIIPEEVVSEKLDERLPTGDTFLEGVSERAGRIAPAAAFGGEGLIAKGTKTAVSAFLGESAKQLGGGELVQGVAELLPFFSPSFSKKIPLKKSQLEMATIAEKLGWSPETLAVAIEDPRKNRVLKKVGTKGGRSEKAIKGALNEVGNGYQSLIQQYPESRLLNEAEKTALFTELDAKMKNLPEKARKKIRVDLNDLKSGDVGIEELINFFQDVNFNHEEKILGQLKDPVQKYLGNISPELASDFDLVNKAYANSAQLREAMKPNLIKQAVRATKDVVLFLTGLTHGNVFMMGEVLGERAGRRVATELIVNPRFKNLSLRLVDALNKNKTVVAKNIYTEMQELIGNEDPEAASEMPELDFDSLIPQGQR